MTAEVLSHQWNTTSKITALWLLPEAGTFITILCPITRKKKTFEYGSKFPHSIFSGLNNGDIIEFDYTEPSSWLSKLFSYPEMHNIITKVKDARLEQLLAKIPKTGLNVKAAIEDGFRYSPYYVIEKDELKLKGSLKDIIKLVYDTIQNTEDFSHIREPHFKFEHFIYFESEFNYGARYKGDTANSSVAGIVIEPVDNINVIIHVVTHSIPDNPAPPISVSPQTLISRIINKLSQANRQ